MLKIKYYFDHDSLQFKRVEASSWATLINSGVVLILALGIACMFTMGYSAWFESPRELKLTQEVNEMEFYYGELSKKVESLSSALTTLEQRDDRIYRLVLGSEPMDPAIREAGRGGYDRYAEIWEKNLDNAELIVKLNEKVDKARRKIYLESLSQDELVRLSAGREKEYAAIPAIQPLSNSSLIAITSGFGFRIHPVFKVNRMHMGIDMVAPEGTPVYSTADGEVTSIEEKIDGYGKIISIDHGFGYVTRYAHLQNFDASAGQKVKRGERIGFVGNTGLSTSPHLHYEVWVHGEPIDPMYYFFNDLSPVEYEQMVSRCAVQNLSAGN